MTSNPPYMNDAHGLKNPDLPKAIARHEVLCTLDDVAREAAKLLRPGGRFYMVHRPHRLIEIITALTKYKLEPKRMKMVHPLSLIHICWGLHLTGWHLKLNIRWMI